MAAEHVVEGGPEGGAHQEVDGEVDRGVQDLLRRWSCHVWANCGEEAIPFARTHWEFLPECVF